MNKAQYLCHDKLYAVNWFKLLLICTFVTVSSLSFCQDKQVVGKSCSQASTDTSIYFTVDSMPQFPGGEVAENRFIDSVRKGLKINPPLEGDVTVFFIVQADGSLAGFRTGDLSFRPDQYKDAFLSALHILKVMPLWIPGKCHGRKVPVYDSVTIKFVED